MIQYQIGAIIGLLSLQSCTPEKEKSTYSVTEKPNILFIAIDDLRPELGCYGNEIIQSPAIDNLAAEGIVFTRAYCNVPVCGASRASLLTGARPTHNRFVDVRSRADSDHPNVPTIPEHFKNNGYYTMNMGKVFHNINDSSHSWDEQWRNTGWKGSWRNYLDKENFALDERENKRGPAYERTNVPDSAYFDGLKTYQAIRDLRRLKEMDKPFFFAMGYVKPHLPFNAPETYWDMYDPEEIGLAYNSFKTCNAPNEAFHNYAELRNYHGIPQEGPLSDSLALTLRHGYYACVSYIDALIGMLLQELDDLGLSDNTIVVVWGDHGYNLGEHSLWAKHCNFNTSLHSPLIIKVPGLTNGNQNHSITEFIDIYPTLCELAGLPLPSHLDGKSLLSRISNPKITEDDYAVCKWENGLTLIEQKYFYTEWYNENDQIIAQMLFDHDVDPDENCNIAQYPMYKEKVEKMSKKLRERRGDNFFAPLEELINK